MNIPDCNTCKYAEWDYEEYEGGYKRYFFDYCRAGVEPDCDTGNCGLWEEEE